MGTLYRLDEELPPEIGEAGDDEIPVGPPEDEDTATVDPEDTEDAE